MKKLLITVCLSGLLSVPSAVLGAEMAGASLYGSFRAGLEFGSGDASISNYGSRWGIKGSHEVSEGLTASYKYEGTIDMTNAEFGGGAGHSHDEAFAEVMGTFSSTSSNNVVTNSCTVGDPYVKGEDGYEAVAAETDEEITGEDAAAVTCGSLLAAEEEDGGPGGRISSISLSGGFGTISLGQFWSASALHYGFAVDPTNFKGSFGGASFRPGNQISYASSAGDVSFQIDKVTGTGERTEFGASAALGPMGVGLGYWKNENDEKSFTGVAISAGAGGVGLAIGLGSTANAMTKDGVGKADTSIISVSGALGDSGISYGVQVTNTDEVNDKGEDKSQNLVSLVNTLGTGASIHLEHLDPSVGDSSSHIVLKVDF